jgi:hypothetical protein
MMEKLVLAFPFSPHTYTHTLRHESARDQMPTMKFSEIDVTVTALSLMIFFSSVVVGVIFLEFFSFPFFAAL